MNIKSLLSLDCVLFKHQCASKKRLLETIASHLCDHNTNLDPSNVFSALIARERLGSTGLGKGIAIPHCRIADCTETIGVLVTLATPIDFNAVDSELVDIIFVLVVPEDGHKDHLQTLATIAETFSDKDCLQRMRKSMNAQELYNIVTT
ncbi:MAG: PTS system nitrogen regulatory IIA component [Pseudohongiellaceae bacterium]|jgi:PTS system nitrogen regulatory IIA component